MFYKPEHLVKEFALYETTEILKRATFHFSLLGVLSHKLSQKLKQLVEGPKLKIQQV